MSYTRVSQPRTEGAGLREGPQGCTGAATHRMREMGRSRASAGCLLLTPRPEAHAGPQAHRDDREGFRSLELLIVLARSVRQTKPKLIFSFSS